VKKYQVRFYIDFEVEAKNEKEARKEADEMFSNTLTQCYFGYVNLFEAEIEEI